MSPVQVVGRGGFGLTIGSCLTSRKSISVGKLKCVRGGCTFWYFVSKANKPTPRTFIYVPRLLMHAFHRRVIDRFISPLHLRSVEEFLKEKAEKSHGQYGKNIGRTLSATYERVLNKKISYFHVSSEYYDVRFFNFIKYRSLLFCLRIFIKYRERSRNLLLLHLLATLKYSNFLPYCVLVFQNVKFVITEGKIILEEYRKNFTKSVQTINYLKILRIFTFLPSITPFKFFNLIIPLPIKIAKTYKDWDKNAIVNYVRLRG